MVTEMKQKTYRLALLIVAQIDAHLSHGTRHYRNKAGELLATLEQVIRAILENDLK